jgi:AcrR family transcriptional regulator
LSTPNERPLRADAIRNRRRALDAATALLAESDTTLSVDAIAKRAGMGAGTVVRAFGGKDALIDAAVAELLEPIVKRGRELQGEGGKLESLRAFMRELMAFQAAHYAVSDQLGGLDLPATSKLRSELVEIVSAMVKRARERGDIRDDIAPAAITTLLGETAFAIAKAGNDNPALADAFITVLFDGLRPTSD